MTRLAIASDHAGYDLKESIKQAFGSEIDWLDLGTHSAEACNYADYGHAMGRAIVEGQAQRGVIICGSGIGISIAANRHKGIRGALCTNATMARLARQHNDANVLALGSRITGRDVALDCVRVFLETPYEGGRHKARVEKIDSAL
jgi:ribose 5-phosphate isomerase B